jgi:uncharacterized protein with HEPN domain
VSFDRRVALLNDIVENCERIARYVRGLDRVMFERDRRTYDAVERCLERICEAAVRLGDDAIALMPHQPWSEIRGTGNWLRHAYDKVDATMIWDTVERDLPGLAEAARTARDQLEQ